MKTGRCRNNKIPYISIGVASRDTDPLELDLINVAPIGLGEDNVVGVELVDIGKLKARHSFLIFVFVSGYCLENKSLDAFNFF
jgi:hypothetical protein